MAVEVNSLGWARIASLHYDHKIVAEVWQKYHRSGEEPTDMAYVADADGYNLSSVQTVEGAMYDFRLIAVRYLTPLGI